MSSGPSDPTEAASPSGSPIGPADEVAPVDLLVVGAHPDDAEYGMGGTLVRHHRAGYRIGVLDLTRGELGSKGTPQLRAQEARHAAEVYGAHFRVGLDLGDNQVGHDRASVHRLATAIRAARPRLVFTHHAEDRHPDHRAAHELVRRGVFTAALSNLDLGVEHHVVAAVLCFPTDRVVDADVYVDVTEVWEDRLTALRRFASQFTAPTRDIDHTLYGVDDYLATTVARARVYGQRIGATFAEAFVTDAGVAATDLVELFEAR